MAISTARLLSTGRVPGRPRQTGQTLVMGGSPKRVEQQRGVEGVAREGIPEEGNAGEIAGGKAGSGFGIGVQKPPDGKIRDQEELDGAEERGNRDAGDGAAVAEPETDGYVDEETGVDDEE